MGRKKTEPANVGVNMRLIQREVDQLTEIAEREDRSVNKVCQRIIREYLTKN